MASVWSRLRQGVGWSNSRQAWEERLGLGLVIGGGVGVWLLAGRLSLLQALLAWGVLVLAAAVLLRRGWLKLFGPVLFYDMIRSARRGRHFLLRVVYAGILLFFLLAAFMDTMRGPVVRHSEAARLAE